MSTELQWRIERPTLPGWWWAKGALLPFVVEVKQSEDDLLAFLDGQWISLTDPEYTIYWSTVHGWSGPITEPTDAHNEH